MSQIPITKIAKDSNIDLRKQQVRGTPKQPSKKWLFLSAILFLIVVFLGINYWFLFSQERPFNDLIPDNAIATAIINQADVYPQVSFFGQQVINKLNQYLNQAELNFSGDILPLFKSQSALIVLPANSDTKLPFLVILKKRVSLAEISQILDKIKPEMNKDFNVSVKDYRQIRMTLFSSLTDSSPKYFYALIEDYLVISNSQESIQEIIDSVISG